MYSRGLTRSHITRSHRHVHSLTHSLSHTPTHYTHTHLTPHTSHIHPTQALVEAMETLNIQYTNTDLKEQAQDLQSVNSDTAVSLSPSHSPVIRSLWADPGLQSCYERRREFQLSDSAK